MDILDVMDLLDVRPHIHSSTDSSLLDDSFTMEPDNLSQSVARDIETQEVAANETTAGAENFAERNLELKLPVLSSSGSDSEPEDPTNQTAATSAGVEGERATSPPPNCAICLGRCKNKCFTDSCMHQFCFKCLCEWSKVKPECPLCKQTFKSIIHNVKSIHQFEEYHVQPPTVQIAHPDGQSIFDVFYPGHNRIQAWNGSTIRPYYLGAAPFSTAGNGGTLPTASGSSSNRSSAASANGSGLRNQYVYRGELLDLYRQEYPGAIANSGTLSQLWRRYVYDRKLYALPVADITGRFRESRARFYRDNPAQIHRLMPWINRDVVCLLRQSQHDVTTVLESINSALTLMDILSPAFRRRLQPFLGNKTAHFIHELNNFARSPYDMIGYDRVVQYSPQTNNEEIVIEFSSSDESTENEQIDVAGESGNSNAMFNSRSRSANSSSTNAINLTIHNRLTSASANAGDNRGPGISGSAGGGGGGVGGIGGLADIQEDVSLVIDLRGESDNNETTSTAQATNNSSNYHLNGQNAGTSESDILTSGIQPAVAENIELTSGSSDECEFVLERKPPHLRTPEMVSLDSASDSDVVFVDESKPLNKTSFSSSEEERNDDTHGHKYPHCNHNKIAALVQAKKRNQSASLVKSEQQDSNSDVYNMGASTSAALRLSLQKRADKSQRSEAASSSKRTRRDKYSLRKNDTQSRAERQAPKRRGKRLNSESSHSNTCSSSATISSSSINTSSSSKSSSSSSDEDYVVSIHRKKASSAGGRESGTRKRVSRIKKAKKLKASKSSNRRTTKHDLRKRKSNAYSSEDDDEEEENEEDEGSRCKNFALVMTINERRKKQDQKKNPHKDEAGDQEVEQGEEGEEESEDENSWRLKVVNDFLRKQQHQNVRTSRKANERKRSSKTSTQHQQNRNNRKRQKFENPQRPEKPTLKAMQFYNLKDTSSDEESDNINLIQLKTKLTGQDCQKNSNIQEISKVETNDETARNAYTATSKNDDNYSTVDSHRRATSSNLNIRTATTTDYQNIPSANATQAEEACCSRNNNDIAKTTLATNEAAGSSTETSKAATKHNSLLNLSDDSNSNNQSGHQRDTIENAINKVSTERNEHAENLDSSVSDLNSQLQNDNANANDDNDNDNAVATTVAATASGTFAAAAAATATSAANNEFCDDDETMSNIPTTMSLNESNVFGDGTSMSATTTDTILHDAAEQISSAAVNFYNPQQTFNTADFADENSTNSSSSDTSASSSSTTSLTSSSNSSSGSSNAYNYNNYDHS